MSPAYIFTKNNGVTIMAIKNEIKQISFDDLEYEAEYTENESNYTTISGKEYQEVYNWEKYYLSDFEVGDLIEGIPELTHFENKDKKYDSLRFRVLDDGEYADLYINIPKPNKLGHISNIRKGFDFYRTCFDFVFSILRLRDERNVVDKNGEEINRFNKVNIIDFAKYVDQMKMVKVKVTEGNSDSDYNSFQIIQME